MVKHPYRLIGITLVVAAVALIIINILVFNALPSPKRMTQGLELDYSVSDPQFQRSMQKLIQFPVFDGNSYQKLQDGEAIYAEMISAIDAAESSVTFETYEFYGEKAAGPFTDALVRAAERGVRVHALIDFIGSVAADNGKFERMEEAGVQLIRYRSPSWYHLASFNHRTHRKLMVVDGEVGFTGGANVGDSWLDQDDHVGYRDYHFRVEGPVVASMQATFAENWLTSSGTLLEGDAYFPELTAQGDTALQMVKSSPSEGRHRVRAMLLYALAAAEHEFIATTAYFYPDRPFLDAMKLALDRGVRIRILVSGSTLDKGFVRHASVNHWQGIIDAGVEIYKYQPTMYHAKLVSVDDHWSTFGSTNLDNRSFRINDEANLVSYDPDFAVMIRETIEADLADAELYTMEEWESRSWYQRLYGTIASALGAHY